MSLGAVPRLRSATAVHRNQLSRRSWLSLCHSACCVFTRVTKHVTLRGTICILFFSIVSLRFSSSFLHTLLCFNSRWWTRWDKANPYCLWEPPHRTAERPPHWSWANEHKWFRWHLFLPAAPYKNTIYQHAHRRAPRHRLGTLLWHASDLGKDLKGSHSWHT